MARTDARGHTTRMAYDLEGRLTWERDPAGAETRYAYDLRGLLAEVENGAGEVTRYRYTARGELAAADYNGAETARFRYDTVGRLVRAEKATSAERFTYDPLGRLTSQYDERLDKTTRYTYDAVGNRTQIIDPEDRVIAYEYDLLGQTTALVDPDGNRTTLAHDALGREVERHLPSGVTTQREFNAAGRMTRVENQGPGGLISAFAYRYDAAGNMLEQVETGAGAPDGPAVTRFRYDDLNRLISATYPDGQLAALRDQYLQPPERYRPWLEDLEASSTEEETAPGRGHKPDKGGNGQGGGKDRKQDGAVSTLRLDPRLNLWLFTEAFASHGSGGPRLASSYPWDLGGFVLLAGKGGNGSANGNGGNNGGGNNNGNAGGDQGGNDNGSAGGSGNGNGNDGNGTGGGNGNGNGNGNPGANGKGRGEEQGRGRSAAKGKGPRWARDLGVDTEIQPWEVYPEEPDYLLDITRRVTYAYDATGNRTEMSTDAGTTRYSYDSAGRPFREEGPAGTFWYSYDGAGRLTAREGEEPQDRAEYAYNPAGQLTAVSLGDQTQVRYGYDALGRKVLRTESIWEAPGEKQPQGNGKGLTSAPGITPMC